VGSSHASGFSGTPFTGQFFRAATKASLKASSAPATSPERDDYHQERIHDSQRELNRHGRGAADTTRGALFAAKPETSFTQLVRHISAARSSAAVF